MRIDPRTKILAIFLLASSAAFSGPAGVGVIFSLSIAILLSIKKGAVILSRSLFAFYIFIVFIILVRSCSAPGEKVLELFWFTMSREGLIDGITMALRLLAPAFLGLALVSTTRPEEMRAGVESILAPFRFIPGKRIGTMLGLLVRFLPQVQRGLSQASMASKARCGDLERNPIARMKKTAFPALVRIFVYAEQLAVAMESRCYSEEATGYELSFNKADIVCASASIAISVTAIFL